MTATAAVQSPAVDWPAVVAEFVAGTRQLPVIPRVVQWLILNLRNEDLSFHEVSSQLAQDPVLAARVLRLVNTPFYAGRRSLTSLADAVSLIGTQALNLLVVSSGVSAAFADVPGVNMRLFWEESLRSSIVAREVARSAGEDTADAQVCGLMQATGFLILASAHPAFLAALPPGSGALLRGPALLEAEAAAVGLRHIVLSAAWVHQLGFPTQVADALRAQGDDTAAPSRLADVLTVASGALTVGRRGEFLLDWTGCPAPALARLDLADLQHPDHPSHRLERLLGDA